MAVAKQPSRWRVLGQQQGHAFQARAFMATGVGATGAWPSVATVAKCQMPCIATGSIPAIMAGRVFDGAAHRTFRRRQPRLARGSAR